MLLSRFQRLYFTLALFIPQSTFASSSSSSPESIIQTVPQCAQSCVGTSLAERFPVACSSKDLHCLCSRYSNLGESLGEVALGCIYSSCSTIDHRAASAYNICLGQEDAVLPTKTALTVVATSASRTSTTSSRAMISITSLAQSTPLQTRTRSTQSIFIDSISTFPSTTPTTTPTSAPVLAPQEAAKMTPAQIAGLSVAAVAGFIMAIGLMALSVCLRRRRERQASMDPDEKSLSKHERIQSERFSHYVPVESGPMPPLQFPPAVPPKARKPNGWRAAQEGPSTIRPVQRLGVGTSNNSSSSSIPLDQIGLAISAELDGSSAVPKTAAKTVARRKEPNGYQNQLPVPLRPASAMTQDTVFEEDDVLAHRRSSILLPTPPIAIAPIRTLQPSRQKPVPVSEQTKRQTARRSELFLDIPLRHERPQPRRIIAAEMPSNGSPKQKAPSRKHLAPPIEMKSSSTSVARSRSTNPRNAGSPGDILDYYLTAHADPTPRVSPAQLVKSRESPQTIQIKSKQSLSTVSRTPSQASTNVRDSVSSQTSFETVDPQDPTPEDEDDRKQLSDDTKQQLSPVAESPISHLKYPKVPRASNQLVPRNERSSPSQTSPSRTPKSTRRAPEHATVLQKRRYDLPPPLLETRPRLQSPHREAVTSPPRRGRGHVRSNSTESWTATPASKIDRASRVQSGAWGKSPVMYEEDMVRPLNVRRKRDEMREINIGRDVDVADQGLKSPVWVPRLTPTRKGEDLFISVGWNNGR